MNPRMKKHILIGFFLLLIPTLYAQDSISDFMSETGDHSESLSVSISGRMLRMAAESDPKATRDFKKLAKDIDKIKMVSNFSMDSDSKKKLKKILQSYEELLVVTESNQKISMYTIENKGKITEFILCIESEDTFILMSILGNFDIKQLSNLSRSVNINGIEHLEKLDNKTNKQK